MLNGKKDKVIKGANVKIADSAKVEDSVIWDDVSIAEDVSLSNSIIGDDVKIPCGKNFKDVAIVRADMLAHCAEIPAKAMQGFFEGENYIVPLDQ